MIDFSEDIAAAKKWAKAIETYMSIDVKFELVEEQVIYGAVVSLLFNIVTEDIIDYSELNDSCLNTAFSFKRGRRFWWISERKTRRLVLFLYPYYHVDKRSEPVLVEAAPETGSLSGILDGLD
jgi:hypothetical protein